MNNLPPFHTIRVLTRCQISLHQDNSYTLHVEETEDTAEWIDYPVENGELIIQTKPMHDGFLLLSDHYPKVQVTCTNLNGIHVLDKAYIANKGEFQVEKLGIIIQQGEIDLNINAIVFDCTVIKRGKATIQGNTLISRVLVHQHGLYNGNELETSDTHVHLHDDGQASVSAEVLDASLFSRSRLLYKGNPRMQVLCIDEGCSIQPLINQDLHKTNINQ
ncbi:DUF2807 domain-containing protein [Olivibacter sp. CPCC 100613]|uniref:GIN domain-containing protein n=1 Tax=Olivibacter sp. CPCC 100613 TaxID=3079931 RepID=UPI002FF9DFDB